ncbi:MAG: hypothetical protein WAQ52_13390 [Terriglobales bacterium]
MSTNPAAQPSAPDPNRAAPSSPTPASNVVDFREGPPGAVEEPRHRAISEGVTSKTWQLATLIVPIVLTTWLTFWVSQKEENIKQDIDKQSQLFSQQLQLSEELYKRRFDAYEKLYAQLVQLNGRLQTQAGAERGDWSKINADQVAHFNELLDLSKLHMSHKVEDLTVGAWIAGARGDGPLLSQSIHDLEAAMKTELDNWMLEEKGASAAASTPSKLKKLRPQTRSSQ